MKPYFENEWGKLYHGDCLEVMQQLEAESVHAIVTDPPYGLGFMGKAWDALPPGVDVMEQCLRVALPGAHLIAFGGSRTYHRLACAVEDAGFEIRDQIQWIYGSGFPKSHDVSKAIDKAAGAEREVVGNNPNHRPISGVEYEGVYSGGNTGAASMTSPATEAAKQWEGFGTALKPSHEPCVLARKPFKGTVAQNVLGHGTGALDIDSCRIGDGEDKTSGGCTGENALHDGGITKRKPVDFSKGRWPANVILDGSPEVVRLFPVTKSGKPCGKKKATHGFEGGWGAGIDVTGFGDEGSAARFFYAAKASKKERGEFNIHPTVKPLALMTYLVTLVCPMGMTVLDPFGGSGTTALAAQSLGRKWVLIEREEEYCEIIAKRLQNNDMSFPLKQDKPKPKETNKGQMSLLEFAGGALNDN